MTTHLVAVDIGGTHTRMAIFRKSEDGICQVTSQRYKSREFSDFEAIASTFLQSWQGEPVAGMSIGVAGPVVNNTVKLTNLAWELNTNALQRKLDLKAVFLLNDLMAHGFGLSLLSDNDLAVIQPGSKQKGNQCIIAAGTGLGECVLLSDSAGHLHPSPSEGGHADFGPACEQDVLLWRFLSRHYDHISWERVVSGRLGFPNLYRFVTEVQGLEKISELSAELEKGGDLSPPLLSAVEASHPTALAIINLFSRLYGAEAGNLALKVMATGGVFVLGGVSRAFRDWICSNHFLEGFTAKGRFSELMRTIPVSLVMSHGNGLRGAAVYGFQQLAGHVGR